MARTLPAAPAYFLFVWLFLVHLLNVSDRAGTSCIRRVVGFASYFNVLTSSILNVSLVFRSHLQHQTLPLLQVHREQRRGQVGAEGQRTEKDPTGN